MLNLNGCLNKAGVEFSTLWSKDFKDEFFRKASASGCATSRITHDQTTSAPRLALWLPRKSGNWGRRWRGSCRHAKPFSGVFDEGCMGMYNAIIEDYLLNPLGVYKERLSQSALVAAMREVSDAEAQAVREWLDARGMTFVTGPNPETDLTDGQILDQCKMYIAAGADRERVRLRRHRHSVPTGPERHGACLRPGRGPAEQRRPAAGVLAKTAANSTPAGRCRISTKWMNAPAWTLLVTNRVWTRHAA